MGPWPTGSASRNVGADNVVTGQWTTHLLEQPARSNATTGQSKPQRLQAAVAAHLGDIARASPVSGSPQVIVTIDNAPRHRGAGGDHVLAPYPHLQLYRLPRYSPQLNVITRCWRGCAVGPPISGCSPA
jgi:hypothetical protein